MPRFLLFGITSILVLLTATRLSAKVFTFNELNCHCEVPDSWIFVDTSGELVHVVDVERQRSFELLVKPISSNITLDNKDFLSGFDRASIPQGFTIKDRREVVLDGIKFHEVLLTKDLGNKSLHVCNYITLADGYGYSLRAETYDIDPEQDDALKSMVQSFAFIKPPHISNAFTYWDIFTPRDASQHDATYLANYRSGVAIGILGFFTLALSIAVGITYGISSLEKETEDTSTDRRTSAGDPAGPLFSGSHSNQSPSLPSQEKKPIYVLMNDGQQMVQDEDDIRKLLREGDLTFENYFWMEGMPEWKSLQELPSRRVTTVAPARRTGDPSTSSPVSVQKPARSQVTTTSGQPGKSATTTHAEVLEAPYRFQFIHKVRFLRLVAAWIDFSLLFAPIVFVHYVTTYFSAHDTSGSDPNFPFFFCLGLYLIVLIITQIVQALRSRSIGKSILRLRVVNVETGIKNPAASSGVLGNQNRTSW